MNIYPNNIASSLGFDQIRTLLIRFCQSDKGKEAVVGIRPVDCARLLRKRHALTREMIKLKNSGQEKVVFRFPEMAPYLTKARIKGSFLPATDFYKLKVAISTLSEWMHFLKNRPEDYPEFHSYSFQVNIDPDLLKAIEAVVDEEGTILSSASPELTAIRKKIGATDQAARSATGETLKKAKQDQLTDADSTLTVREGRLVIPIRAAFKKRIDGFVHDESATGKTVYIEPESVLALNNKARGLRYAEQREITRILIALSDHVRSNLSDLEKGSVLMKKLDITHAKARLAEYLNGIVPAFRDQPSFQWVNAVHPLLYLSNKASGKSVVPLVIQLDQTNRILIVSGPNTGGKSVVLKTVGLLQYMFQCGLPTPVGEASEFGVFSSLFLDIGDTQSMESALSTYSSHLTAMRYFLKHADRRTLILIDEFGKGTDPQFGGAIAETILLRLNENKPYGVVTTHCPNLKKAAENTKGLINGAMRYDPGALRPLFKLETGKTGSSFALETAEKIGLPDSIITKSKEKIGSDKIAYNTLLHQLEKEKLAYEKQSAEITAELSVLRKVKKDYEGLFETLKAERGNMMKEARREARQIISDANREVERVIREIKEAKADKKRTKELRVALSQKASGLGHEEEVIQKNEKIEVGGTVKIEGQQVAGVVQKVSGRQAEVLFGAIKSIVAVDKLLPATPSPYQKCQKQIVKMGIDLSDRAARFNHQLNIRGLHVEAAMSEIVRFIDEAVLLGVSHIKIIHGKGHGVLRKMVREYAKEHPQVASAQDEHADRGGAGVSLIELQ